MEERFTVAGLLRTHASARPDAPMLTLHGNTVSWATHYQRACTLANALAAEGVGPGERVAFLDRSGMAYFEVLFGGALAGAVNVAVNWRLAPAEMAAIIDDAAARVLVVHADYVPALAQMASGLPAVRRIVVIGDPRVATGGGGASDAARRVGYEDWLADRPATDPGHRGTPEEVSMQLYTSGTTGLPKGVMLTNANLSTAIGGASTTFGIDESTVSLIAMPLFHIGGSGWALCGMSRGGHSVILRDMDPAELLRLVARHGVTETFVVPAVLMFVLATDAIATTDLSSLRTVFYGASPIAEDVLVRCLDVFRCGFAQVYGMTETTGAITLLRPEDHDPDGPRRHLLRSAGRPLPDVELRIIDPSSGAQLPPGKVGEVVTRSAYNMAGYWRKPEDTARTVEPDGWLHTGDAGYLDEEGYLFLHDRIKDMIVSGGENVYPAEVENVLLSLAGVADAAVIGVPHDTWGETVKAIVVRAPGAELDAATVMTFCRLRLAHFKCPTSVDFVEALPRNPSGKILKRELREPYWQGQGRRIS